MRDNCRYVSVSLALRRRAGSVCLHLAEEREGVPRVEGAHGAQLVEGDRVGRREVAREMDVVDVEEQTDGRRLQTPRVDQNRPSTQRGLALAADWQGLALAWLRSGRAQQSSAPWRRGRA